MAFGQTVGQKYSKFAKNCSISINLPMFTIYFAFDIAINNIAIASAVVDLTLSIYKMQRKQKIEILNSRDVKIIYINQKGLLN